MEKYSASKNTIDLGPEIVSEFHVRGNSKYRKKKPVIFRSHFFSRVKIHSHIRSDVTRPHVTESPRILQYFPVCERISFKGIRLLEHDLNPTRARTAVDYMSDEDESLETFYTGKYTSASVFEIAYSRSEGTY